MRAEAISISATIRAVAKTAGKESFGESASEHARSVYETVREATAFAPGSGAEGVAISCSDFDFGAVVMLQVKFVEEVRRESAQSAGYDIGRSALAANL